MTTLPWKICFHTKLAVFRVHIDLGECTQCYHENWGLSKKYDMEHWHDDLFSKNTLVPKI
jgi:hypothetical protein